ncbi:hypothetical protein N7535_002567 [Penicillium sp. DV-2018c]|nr:hypothetical protein N7461_001748 [Penicillium sp. DV-2018c]KAJ5575641.1 hypothetical protein N7535_002567 [Penicillium sp. DV-2018c]
MGNDEDINRRDGSPRHRDWFDHESNPFEAFRRYADEQVSTMLQSIIGLPSMLTTPHNGHWDIVVNDHEYKRTMSRQRTGDESDQGRSYSTDRDNTSGYPADRDGDDARNRGKSHWLEDDEPWHPRSWRKWGNGPSSFFGLDSMFDRFWFEDRFSPLATHLLHPGHNILFSDLFEDATSPTWPISYIMFSPYSPLHLERQAKRASHGEKGILSSILPSLHLHSDERDPSEPQWREAFEDLLRLENGKPMLNRDTPTKQETGSDWLQSLVKRGSLGDRWKLVPHSEGQPWSGITYSGPADPKQDQSRALLEEEESADTELDLYERFLQDIENREREFFRGASGSPLLRLLLDERRQQQEELENYRSSVPMTADDHNSNENEFSTDIAPGAIKTPVSEFSKDSSTEMETKPTTVASKTELPRVVSTINRTERVRLADGSVRTKTVNTKRYADGREESDESVEVSHPQEGSGSDPEKPKNSWFWKD